MSIHHVCTVRVITTEKKYHYVSLRETTTSEILSNRDVLVTEVHRRAIYNKSINISNTWLYKASKFWFAIWLAEECFCGFFLSVFFYFLRNPYHSADRRSLSNSDGNVTPSRIESSAMPWEIHKTGRLRNITCTTLYFVAWTVKIVSAAIETPVMSFQLICE